MASSAPESSMSRSRGPLLPIGSHTGPAGLKSAVLDASACELSVRAQVATTTLRWVSTLRASRSRRGLGNENRTQVRCPLARSSLA